MSSRQDYAKKNTRNTKSKKKSRKGAKTRGNIVLRVFFLTLICASIAYVYYARQNLLNLQPEKISVVNATEKPKFEFYSKTPVVVQKAEKKPELKVAKASKQNGPYQIQVASTTKADEADQLKAELILDGYNVATKSVKSAQGQEIKVTVGPYPTLAEAKSAADILKANSYEGEISQLG